MNEIQVNATGSGGPISILGTAAGQIVVAWTAPGVITCARFSGTGAKLGDTFTVNGPDAPATWPILAVTQRGFVVAWTSGGNLLLQGMADDGSKIGAPIQVNQTNVTVDPASPPAIAGLVDGALVVCWADATQEVVRGQIFRGDLSRFGGPFVVNVPTDNDFGVSGGTIPHGPVNHQPSVAGLTVGDTGYAFVVAWRRGMSVETTVAHYRFFNPDSSGETLPPGGPGSAPFEHMAKYDLLCGPNSIAAVTGGGFCGVRLASAGMQQPVLMADLYDSTGGFLESVNITHVADGTSSANPVILQTPTNDLVIAWAEYDQTVAANPGWNIRGMVTTGSLGPAGAVTISSPPSGVQDGPHIRCVVTDSGFTTAVAWLEGSAIKMRVLDGNNLVQDA